MIAPILGPDYAKSATIENGLSASELQSAQTNFGSELIGSGLKASEMMRQLPTQLYNDTETIFHNLLGGRVIDQNTQSYTGARDSQGLLGRAATIEGREEYNRQHDEALEKMKNDTLESFNTLQQGGFEFLNQDIKNMPKERQNLLGKATQDAGSGLLGNNDAEIKQKLTDPNGQYKLSNKEANYALIGKNQVLEQKDRQNAQFTRTVQTERNMAIDDINNMKIARMTGNPNYTFEETMDVYNEMLTAYAGASVSQAAMEIKKNNGIEGTSIAAQLKKSMPEIDLQKVEREILALEKISVDSANARNGVLNQEYANGEVYRVSRALQARGMSGAQADYVAMVAAGVPSKDFATAEQNYMKNADAKRLNINQTFNEIKDKDGKVIGYNTGWGNKTTTSTSTSSSKKVIGPGSKTTENENKTIRPYNKVYIHDNGTYYNEDFKNGEAFEMEGATEYADPQAAQELKSRIEKKKQEREVRAWMRPSPEEIAPYDKEIADLEDQLNKMPKTPRKIKKDELMETNIQSVRKKDGSIEYYITHPKTGEKIVYDHIIKNDGNGIEKEYLVDSSGREFLLYSEEEGTTTTEGTSAINMSVEQREKIEEQKKNIHKSYYEDINYFGKENDENKPLTKNFWFAGEKGIVHSKGVGKTFPEEEERRKSLEDPYRILTIYNGETGQVVKRGNKYKFVPLRYLQINDTNSIAYDLVFGYDEKITDELLKKDGKTFDDLETLKMYTGDGEKSYKEQKQNSDKMIDISFKLSQKDGLMNLPDEEAAFYVKQQFGLEWKDFDDKEKKRAVSNGFQEMYRSHQADSTNPLMFTKNEKGEPRTYDPQEFAISDFITIISKNGALGTNKIEKKIFAALQHETYEDRKAALTQVFDDHKNALMYLNKYVKNDQLADIIIELHNIFSDTEKIEKYHGNVLIALTGITSQNNLEDMMAVINKGEWEKYKAEQEKAKAKQESNNNKGN